MSEANFIRCIGVPLIFINFFQHELVRSVSYEQMLYHVVPVHRPISVTAILVFCQLVPFIFLDFLLDLE